MIFYNSDSDEKICKEFICYKIFVILNLEINAHYKIQSSYAIFVTFNLRQYTTIVFFLLYRSLQITYNPFLLKSLIVVNIGP